MFPSLHLRAHIMHRVQFEPQCWRLLVTLNPGVSPPGETYSRKIMYTEHRSQTHAVPEFVQKRHVYKLSSGLILSVRSLCSLLWADLQVQQRLLAIVMGVFFCKMELKRALRVIINSAWHSLCLKPPKVKVTVDPSQCSGFNPFQESKKDERLEASS